MGAILHLGGRRVEIDRIFTDGGSPPVFGMVGNQRMLIEPGHAARPMVLMRDGAFFTPDLEPVKDPDLVNWFPEPFRTRALAFVEKQQHGGKGAQVPKEKLPQQIRKSAPKKVKRTLKFDPKQALGPSAERAVPVDAPLPQM